VSGVKSGFGKTGGTITLFHGSDLKPIATRAFSE
jgi:hypothetical protein